MGRSAYVHPAGVSGSWVEQSRERTQGRGSLSEFLPHGDTGLQRGARQPCPGAKGGTHAQNELGVPEHGLGQAGASPGLRGAREDAGQRGQRRGRLAGALESVDEDAGHQRSLEGRWRRAGSAVQIECCSGVQVGNETLRVEIRRREHSLERRVIACLR